MDSGIIISLILGGASIISSICFGLVPSIRKNKFDKLKTRQQKLLWDIKLFYDIEKELLNKLESHGHNKETTKKQVRKLVFDSNDRRLSDYSQPSKFDNLIEK